MIDLYAFPTSNGLRAKIMLDECGLDYTLHAVDLAKGEHHTPEFLKINPMGLIPAMVDSDGPDGKPMTLTQSMAILTYLAGKSGKFLPESCAQNPLFWQDVMSIATDLSANLMGVFTLQRLPEKHAPSIDSFGNRFNAQLKVWDGVMADRKYVGGDEVTIADFALHPVLYRCKQVTPQYAEGCPNIERWYAEIDARPGVRKGVDFG